jgi:signal transduction histidine kinase
VSDDRAPPTSASSGATASADGLYGFADTGHRAGPYPDDVRRTAVAGLLTPRASRWLLVIDALVLVTLVVAVTVDDADLMYKVAFFLLAVAAFLWDPAAYWTRAIVWGALTSTVVVWAVATERADLGELLDVVFFAAILAVAYVVNVQRAESARRIDALLDEERARVVELETLAALKADFTAMVVHEFGNPLAALRRSNELLRLDDLDPSTRARTLEAIRTELGVLETLVADVTASLEVHRDDFEIRPAAVEVAALAADVDAHGRSVCGPRSFLVSVDPALDATAVSVDRARIGQVLRNLVANAVKYTPADSRIEVRFGTDGPHLLRVEVDDDGPGLDEADAARLVEPYFRAATAVGSDTPGMGLGLHVCQRLLHAHGSELTVASAPGQGARFSFTLPLAEDLEPALEAR